MTEKRSAYRREQGRRKGKKLFKKVASAFDDSQDASVDVNPAFKREPERPKVDQGTKSYSFSSQAAAPTVDKGLRLKKKLDRAILVVLVLIIVVLLALFYL